MRRALLTLFSVVLAAVSCSTSLPAQSYRRGGTEFNASRKVTIPSKEKYSIVVTQFFHHGQITPDGRNVLVFGRDNKPVPTRVLQLGPGDYCRLAFQTAARQREYDIYYGGEPPAKQEVPLWTDNSGLFLETRQYRECNLNSLESVRKAFESSQRIGSDYVANVQHAFNPFLLTDGPFLSRYSGYLRVSSAGTYGFFTASQDCSFLLIDGKLVVDAPGRHGPLRRAAPGTRKDVQLSAGAHKFEYYHVATGPRAIMVAAWEVAPRGSRPQPAAIPTEAFGTAAIGRLRTAPVQMRTEKLIPDFIVSISGEVPLPDNPVPLIGVQFKNISSPALTTKAKILWDFGDGQTSEQLNPDHVYLRPGLYTVKLAVKRGLKTVETINRVYIDRPRILKRRKGAESHELDQYLPILKTYEPRTLDAAGLRQLVLAYVWKADRLLSPRPGDTSKTDKGKEDQPEKPTSPDKLAELEAARKAEVTEYVTLAATAGQAAFLEDSAAEGDEDLHKLVRLIGPMTRDQRGDSALAAKVWHRAAEKITRAELKAECEMEAADVALNDLLNPKAAKPVLDAATARLGPAQAGPVASRLQRIWGDYYATTGDGMAARKAYAQAEAILGSTRSHVERAAWRGAHSRSTERFLKSGELDRAAVQLRAWQDEFPAEKIGGYLHLLFARYWAARQMHPQAISLAEQVLSVNPDSPYIDQLLLLAADCEVKRGRVDRALATLHSLVKDYPGSPLVPTVRKNIAKLEAGEKKK